MIHRLYGLLTLAALALPAQSPLASLPMLTPNANNRMVSPENPSGKKGQGAMAVPNPSDPDLAFSGAPMDLGQGWKVRPFIKVKPHETVTQMDVSGPGVIQHIWMATAPDWLGNGRASELRFYWNGEATPSVEVPLTDFFALNRASWTNSPAQEFRLTCAGPWPKRLHRGCEPKIMGRSLFSVISTTGSKQAEALSSV